MPAKTVKTQNNSLANVPGLITTGISFLPPFKINKPNEKL
jgi:hypothetical protein